LISKVILIAIKVFGCRVFTLLLFTLLLLEEALVFDLFGFFFNLSSKKVIIFLRSLKTLVGLEVSHVVLVVLELAPRIS